LFDTKKLEFQTPEEILTNMRNNFANNGLDPNDANRLIASSSPEHLKVIRVQQDIINTEVRKSADEMLVLAKELQSKTGDDFNEFEIKFDEAVERHARFLELYSSYGTESSRLLSDRKIKNGGRISSKDVPEETIKPVIETEEEKIKQEDEMSDIIKQIDDITDKYRNFNSNYLIHIFNAGYYGKK
jgi:hypothetical protein